MRIIFIVGVIMAGSALGADEFGINDMPDIKEGLWESITMMPGLDQPVRGSLCISNAVYKKMSAEFHNSGNHVCKQIRAERHGSVYTSEVECNFNGKVSRSTSVATFKGNTEMRTEMQEQGTGKVRSVIDMKWVSACPTGMKLGDVAGPDGKVMMNVMSP